MANPTSPGAKFQEHPMLKKLLAAGAADSMTYWGYVGPSTASGRITFYPSLNNLSVSLEIAMDDIIHVEDVPETILPFGAKVIWIKKDASIGRRFEVEGAGARRSEMTSSRSRRGVSSCRRQRNCARPTALLHAARAILIAACVSQYAGSRCSRPTNCHSGTNW
jgi:hypothetical protein